MRVFSSLDLEWSGNRLLHSGRVVATVQPDRKWNGLWRVLMPDGRLSDVVNFTRARDAARSLALMALNEDRREAA
jgi:hypothetical protein